MDSLKVFLLAKIGIISINDKKMLIFKIEKLNSHFERRENDYERAFDTH